MTPPPPPGSGAWPDEEDDDGFDDLPETHLDEEDYDAFVAREFDPAGRPKGEPRVLLWIVFLTALLLALAFLWRR